jgi:hypothetical protein
MLDYEKNDDVDHDVVGAVCIKHGTSVVCNLGAKGLVRASANWRAVGIYDN